MNDCPNGDVRDLLPEYLHERLDAEANARVRAHLFSCADCQAEFDLLRDMQAMLGGAPTVDVAAIASAIPAYRAPARRSWVGWKAAAAITVMIAGGSSVVVMNNRSAIDPVDTSRAVVLPTEVPAIPVQKSPASSVPGLAPGTHVVTTPPFVPAAPVQKAPVVSETARPARELAMGGGALGDLSDNELASLLKDIEAMDGVPGTDIDNVSATPLAPVGGGRGRP